MLYCNDRGLCPIGYAQFFQNRADVVSNRPFGEVQGSSNVGVGHSLSKQTEHIQFAFGEFIFQNGGGLGLVSSVN